MGTIKLICALTFTVTYQLPLRKGSTCALITPFTEDGEIDIPVLKRLVQLHIDQETDNLCVLGTTSEASVMSMEERKLVLGTIVEMAKGKIPLMVGTGTINPDSVKAQTQQAIDLGADACLVVTPYYVKPPQRALVRHFVDVADLGLPVVLYNVPGRTKCDMDDDTIVTLSKHENIVGVKDATGDLSRLSSLIEALGEGNESFLKFSGDDHTTTDYILHGGDGCISVTANLVPGTMHQMAHAALNGHEEVARNLNEPLAKLHQDLFIESSPIPAKWAAKQMGLIDTAYCRPPLDELDPKFEEVVKKALKAAELPIMESEMSVEIASRLREEALSRRDQNFLV
eukprot:scaffold5024_cov136-Cylindrotheca_fusiformis.AAC.4